MRKPRDFVASYPVGTSRCAKRRMPLEVRSDLKWWNQLLPIYNGVQFYDTQNREPIPLLLTLRGFFYKNNADFLVQLYIIYSATTSLCSSNSQCIPHQHPRVEGYYIGNGSLGVKTGQNSIHSVYRQRCTPASYRFTHHTFRGASNSTLRKFLLLAAQYDIAIQPRWLPSEDNGLADALSRLVNPQWLAYVHIGRRLSSILLPQSLQTQSKTYQCPQRHSFRTDYLPKLVCFMILQATRTSYSALFAAPKLGQRQGRFDRMNHGTSTWVCSTKTRAD